MICMVYFKCVSCRNYTFKPTALNRTIYFHMVRKYIHIWSVFIWMCTAFQVFGVGSLKWFTRSFRKHYNMLICCSRNISYHHHQCWKQLCCTIFFMKTEMCNNFFSGLFYRWKVQNKNSIYLKYKSLVTFEMSLSHLINVIHPCLINVFSFKNHKNVIVHTC